MPRRNSEAGSGTGGGVASSAYQRTVSNQDPSLKALPVSGGPSTAFVTTQGKNVDESHFSPDGRWIAYNSNDAGVWQVYVAPFPANGQRWQVSANGGVDARWRGDGRELFYLSVAGEMMSVDIGTSVERIDASAPRRIFDAQVDINARMDHCAVTADGRRFLLKRPLERGSRNPWTVVLNWTKLLPQVALSSDAVPRASPNESSLVRSVE